MVNGDPNYLSEPVNDFVAKAGATCDSGFVYTGKPAVCKFSRDAGEGQWDPRRLVCRTSKYGTWSMIRFAETCTDVIDPLAWTGFTYSDYPPSHEGSSLATPNDCAAGLEFDQGSAIPTVCILTGGEAVWSGAPAYCRPSMSSINVIGFRSL